MPRFNLQQFEQGYSGRQRHVAADEVEAERESEQVPSGAGHLTRTISWSRDSW